MATTPLTDEEVMTSLLWPCVAAPPLWNSALFREELRAVLQVAVFRADFEYFDSNKDGFIDMEEVCRHTYLHTIVGAVPPDRSQPRASMCRCLGC